MRLSDTLQPPSGTGCGITSQRFNFCTVLDALLNPLDFLTRHTHLCRLCRQRYFIGLSWVFDRYLLGSFESVRLSDTSHTPVQTGCGQTTQRSQFWHNCYYSFESVRLSDTLYTLMETGCGKSTQLPQFWHTCYYSFESIRLSNTQKVSSAEYRLFYRALLQKRHMIFSILTHLLILLWINQTF